MHSMSEDAQDAQEVWEAQMQVQMDGPTNGGVDEQQQQQQQQQEEAERAQPLIILIISDDERLRPFGPVIEYNGRDAFEIGAVGTVVAALDGRADESPIARFYFQHLEM